jgi:hypothetical protein
LLFVAREDFSLSEIKAERNTLCKERGNAEDSKKPVPPMVKEYFVLARPRAAVKGFAA